MSEKRCGSPLRPWAFRAGPNRSAAFNDWADRSRRYLTSGVSSRFAHSRIEPS